MIIVNNLNNEQIVGTVNGKQFSVAYGTDSTKYDLMKALEAKANQAQTVDEVKTIIEEFEPLTKESYKEIVETICPYIKVNKNTNKFYLSYNGVVSNRPMPNTFAEKIVASSEKGIDVSPIIKCWARYLREVPGRPAYSQQRASDFGHYISANYTNEAKVQQLMKDEGLSRDIAVKKATTPQVAITQEGLLVCYKVSTEVRHKYQLNEDEEVVTKSRYTPTVDPDTGVITYDEPNHSEDLLFEPAVMGQRGDEFNCVSLDGTSIVKKGHHIRVGCSHFLDSWDQVGPPMGPGLHCGGLSYIANYQGEGTVTHNIFVDPQDIHTVRTDGDGAMTCKKYFVHSSMKGVNKNLYHSSTYAALGDSEYHKILEEVTKATAMKAEELKQFETEARSLVDSPSTPTATLSIQESDDLPI